MSGLFAWAADVVGGNGQGEDDGEGRLSWLVFTPEQQRYVGDLDRKAETLRRVIHELRTRIPPQDISESLPHLHAHSVASSEALALQLNAHSTTRQQTQQREVTLQEENIAYEKAILACQKKIQEKQQEADSLQSQLKDMDINEKELREELVELQSKMQHSPIDASIHDPDGQTTQSSRSILLNEVDEKKKDLISMEESVNYLENKWTQIQQDSIKKPSPAQREKTLERQLHDLIEQLTAKQGQAESLITEIREKDLEYQKLNGLRRKLDNSTMEAYTTRNRFVRNFSGQASAYYSGADTNSRNLNWGKSVSQQKSMFLRSAIVLYILALHLIVFFKISI